MNARGTSRTNRSDSYRTVALVLLAVPLAALLTGGPDALNGLPFLAMPLLAALALGRAMGLAPRDAALGAVALTVPVWLLAALVRGQAAPALLCDAVFLGFGALAVRQGIRHRRSVSDIARTAGVFVAAASVLSLLVVINNPRPTAVAPAPTTQDQPELTLPVSVDPHGVRALVVGLYRDDTLSMVGVPTGGGAAHEIYRGYPMPAADWSPDGSQLVFPASDKPWFGGDQPFALYVASSHKGKAKELLGEPGGGNTWMFPLWSLQGEMVGAWRMATRMPGGQAPAADDLPSTWVVPASGGSPQQRGVPGTRLSLLGAWQADGEGLYQITERGVYLNPKDGRAKRLIPAGESTLDPLPFVVPELVAPNGKYLGWFDMHYNRTGIERMDLGVMPLRERGRKVHLKNLVLAAAGWSRNGEVLAALQNARGGLRLALFDTTEGKLKTYRTKLQLIDDQFPTRAFVSHSGRYVVLNGPITDHAFLSTVVFDRQEETLTVLDAFGDHIVGGWTTDDRIVLGDMIMVMTIRPDGGDQRIIYPPGTDAHAFRVSPAPSQLRERVAPLLNAPWQQRWAAVR